VRAEVEEHVVVDLATAGTQHEDAVGVRAIERLLDPAVLDLAADDQVAVRAGREGDRPARAAVEVQAVDHDVGPVLDAQVLDVDVPGDPRVVLRRRGRRWELRAQGDRIARRAAVRPVRAGIGARRHLDDVPGRRHVERVLDGAERLRLGAGIAVAAVGRNVDGRPRGGGVDHRQLYRPWSAVAVRVADAVLEAVALIAVDRAGDELDVLVRAHAGGAVRGRDRVGPTRPVPELDG